MAVSHRQLSRVEAQKALTAAEATAKADEAAAVCPVRLRARSPMQGLEERAEASRRRVGKPATQLVRLG